MNLKKILLATTASLLAVSAIIGCGAKPVPVSDTEKVAAVSNVTQLAYKYGAEEKAHLAAEGLFYDFDGESVGTVYSNEDVGTVSSAIFSYRPKWSDFEVVASEDGNALRYERNAVSAQRDVDPHIDVELGQTIPEKTDFVAEFDFKSTSEDSDFGIIQTIYRPSSGNVFGTALHIKNNVLYWQESQITTLPEGEFSKIACVMHQSVGTLDVYVNGYLVEYGLRYIEAKNIGHLP